MPLDRLAADKHSSLLVRSVDDEEKSSIALTPVPNFIKLFPRDLRIFVISKSVCPWQAFPIWSSKHSSLVRKSVNLAKKKFYNIGTWMSSHHQRHHCRELRSIYHNLLSIMCIQVQCAPKFHNDFWQKNYFNFPRIISLQVYLS